MKVNDKGLIYLDSDSMNAIFDCVYGINGFQNSNTKKLLKDRMFKDLVTLLNNLQEYNYQYRSQQACELADIFETKVGPMQTNSDGPIIWFSLGLAIKELYGMRRSTLKELLQLITVRK